MARRRGNGDSEGPFRVRPFAGLRSLKEKVPSAPAPKEPPERGRSPEPPGEDLDDDEAFVRAMSDVAPLDSKHRVRSSRKAAAPRTVDEDRAVVDYLRDLVDGSLPFDIADTDEYIEGAAQGTDRRIIKKLRRGEFSIQAHLDLHGYNKQEARDEVARFIKKSVGRGLRCVLIVHGRGLRSKDQIPVLKEKLKAWLTRGSIGAVVLAFASARPYDGGTGAVYVLLRR